MAKFRTDYVDAEWTGNRKYKITIDGIEHTGATIEDTTQYAQEGSEVGAKFFNEAGNTLNSVDDIKDSFDNATQKRTTTFNDDGSIKESLADGRYKVTTFADDGTITETFYSATGTVVGTRTTTFAEDGSITEAVTNDVA